MTVCQPEPDFIAQTGEPMTVEEKREWIRRGCRNAEAKGATFHRASVHPEHADLLLLESWKVRPEDQGEPRFQFCAGDR